MLTSKIKDHNSPYQANRFFNANSNPPTINTDKSLLIQEMENTLFDSVLKRRFVISLLLNIDKLDKVLQVENVTRYLTPQDVNKIAANSESCCNRFIKAGIYKNDQETWKKLECLAEHHDIMSHKNAPIYHVKN